MRRRGGTWAGIFLGLLAVGCARHNVAMGDSNNPPPPSSGGMFVSQTHHIALSWPAGWQKHPSQDFDLLLWPDGATDSPIQWLSLDVPDLPIHIPGLIPLSAVKNGYLDDLRKQAGQIEVQDQTPPEIPHAKIGLVRSTWQANGRDFSETALILIHEDHVFILRARTDAKHEPAVHEAFDKMVHSLRWSES